MTATLSGVIVISAFGLVAAAGLILVVSLYRISGRSGGGSDGDTGQVDPGGG
jgi:hypothetical protein